VVLKCEP